MKTIYIGESRKDFLENWKSINRDLVVPKFGLCQNLRFYEKMAMQKKLGLFISNVAELKMEYVNLVGIANYFKHSSSKFLNDGFNYSWNQIPKENHHFVIGYRLIMSETVNKCKPEERLKVEAFVDYGYKLAENEPEYFRMFQHIKIFEADKNNKPLFVINI